MKHRLHGWYINHEVVIGLLGKWKWKYEEVRLLSILLSANSQYSLQFLKGADCFLFIFSVKCHVLSTVDCQNIFVKCSNPWLGRNGCYRHWSERSQRGLKRRDSYRILTEMTGFWGIVKSILVIPLKAHELPDIWPWLEPWVLITFLRKV